MTKSFRIDDKCPGIKVWYDLKDWVKKTCFRSKGEHWLRTWAGFLDTVVRLPKNRQICLISKSVWLMEELCDYYSEEELSQLTKFETKTEIFKIDLEEYL